MTLDDIREVFNHGFGLRYKPQVEREAKQMRKLASDV